LINACTPLNANVGTDTIVVILADGSGATTPQSFDVTDIDVGDALSVTDAIADNGSGDATTG